MAGRACHVVGYATQVGLTQALGPTLKYPVTQTAHPHAPWSKRLLEWLTGFGFVFTLAFALIALALALFGSNYSLGLSGFCGGVIALYWASWHSKRSSLWLIAGVPGFLLFVGSALVVLWRMA